MKRTIVFKDRVFASIDAMPPDLRREYEEALRKVGDTSQDGTANVVKTSVSGIVKRTFVVNGVKFSSPEEMPPDVRRTYEQLLGRFDKNQNGIPDFIENSTERLMEEVGTRHNTNVKTFSLTFSSDSENKGSAAKWIILLMFVIALSLALLALKEFGAFKGIFD
jgi:hypothetical protein